MVVRLKSVLCGERNKVIFTLHSQVLVTKLFFSHSQAFYIIYHQIRNSLGLRLVLRGHSGREWPSTISHSRAIITYGM